MGERADNQPWTILRLITWTKDYLASKGVDSPRLAAEVLLAHVLGSPRIALYAQFEKVPAAEQLAQYRELVKRAGAHEPVAYLVGHKEFYSLDFLVDEHVLIPRPETELLVDAALEHLARAAAGAADAVAKKAGRPHYWDAFTGSGCVAAAVGKHAAEAQILATDLSDDALAIARQNLEKHGLTPRATVARADSLSLPADLASLAPFDVITANPPYVRDSDMAGLPADVRHEPASALAAGPDGLKYILPILAAAHAHLAPGGLVAIEIGAGQAPAVWEAVAAATQYERPRFIKDLAGIERVLVAYKS
jgi:release factor glutamine methyltransferase